MPTVVDSLYDEFKALRDLLSASGEISLQSSADATFRKTLLLAAASYFETQVLDALLAFCAERTRDDELLLAFVKNQALHRRYHTLFSWGQPNANAFFSLFGEGFKDFMRGELSRDDDLTDAITAFLDIGNERNRLVHTNFAAFVMEKTTDEIYSVYRSGCRFVEALPRKLREYRAERTIATAGMWRQDVGWLPFRYGR